MRTSRRRLLISALAAAAVLLTGTACATTATSAAIVGDVSIAEQAIFDQTAQVSDQAAAAGRPLSVDELAFYNRRQTTNAIRSSLLAQAAQDLGVAVTDAEVNAAMLDPTSGTSATGAGAQDFRDQLLLEGVLKAHGGEELTFTNVTLTVDGVVASTHEDAVRAQQAILAVPADAPIPALDSAVQQLQAGTIDLLTTPQSERIGGVLSARPGDVLVNQESDRYFVVRVVDRSVGPDQVSATAILGAPDVGVQRQAAAVALLQEYAERTGISVNPRIGIWDPIGLQVVATPTAS